MLNSAVMTSVFPLSLSLIVSGEQKLLQMDLPSCQRMSSNISVFSLGGKSSSGVSGIDLRWINTSQENTVIHPDVLSYGHVDGYCFQQSSLINLEKFFSVVRRVPEHKSCTHTHIIGREDTVTHIVPFIKPLKLSFT